MPLTTHDLVRLEAQLEQRGLQRGQHGEIAAARAPVGVDSALVGVLGQRRRLGGGWRVRRGAAIGAHGVVFRR